MNVPNIINLQLTEAFLRNNLDVPQEFQTKINNLIEKYNKLMEQSKQYYLQAANPQNIQFSSSSYEKRADKIQQQQNKAEKPSNQLQIDILKTQTYKALTDSKLKKIMNISPQQEQGRFGLTSTEINDSQHNSTNKEINISISPQNQAPIMHQHSPFNPLENFNILNNFQLKAAMHQIKKRFTTRDNAIKQLTEYYQQTGQLPRINLKQFQLTSPNTKMNINEQIKNFIMNSGWYTLVITHVPLDLDCLMKNLKDSGVHTSKQYVEDYLVSEGVLIASKINNSDEKHVSIEPEIVNQITGIQQKDKSKQIKKQSKQKQQDDNYKQLTLSQMFKNKKQTQ